MNPRYLLGPCDRPGCTKQHGVRLATSAPQSASAHPLVKPMTGASSPKPDAGLWATGRASDPPEPVKPALAGSPAET